MILYPIHRVVASLVALAMLSVSVTSAQTTRESLKNPVYRVSKVSETSESTSEIHAPAQAPVEALAKAEVNAGAAPDSPAPPTPTTTATPPKSTATHPVEIVASRTPLAKPKVTAEPTPKQILGYAIDDAKLQLEHISVNIDDYTCDFIKRERVDGELLPAEHIAMKVRNRKIEDGKVIKPFSVYMKFKAPTEQRNREILYIEGENNEKMLAKEGGSRGKWLPSVWLRTDSSFAMNTNRYPITQVGVQRLAERLIESAEANTTTDACKIKYTRGTQVCGRTCSYLEVVRENRRPGPLGPNNIYLVQIFLDENLKIPVRYAAYDWPTTKGGRPVPLEEYTYQNIRLNVGLSDIDFDKDNPDYNF